MRIQDRNFIKMATKLNDSYKHFQQAQVPVVVERQKQENVKNAKRKLKTFDSYTK